LGEEECVKDIGGRARRKRSLGRLRCKWIDNMKADLGE
jgi:hypothetical protein